MRIKIIALLALTSCGTDYMIDERLKPHVDNFYYLSGNELQKENLVVRRKKNLLNETGSIGRTIKERGFLDLWDGQITVLIDEDYCHNNDFLMVETTVFHELGHALLDREHTDNVPSLMSSRGEYSGYRRKWNDPKTYSDQLRDNLRHELFNRK